MGRAFKAYHRVISWDYFKEIERMRDKAGHDEAQALYNARELERAQVMEEVKKEGELKDKEVARAKAESARKDKQMARKEKELARAKAEVARKDERIALLRAALAPRPK